jgi:serine/threonine-protein kinase
VVLLDWGVAKVWADAAADGVDERMQHEVLTDVNQRPGTPLYMSPEQVRGGGAGIDHRTDVYSLGAVLYEFLTLSEPLRGKRVQDTFNMIVSEAPQPPRERAPQRQIPQTLADIAMRALAKNPDDRYKKMTDFVDAIADFRAKAISDASS